MSESVKSGILAILVIGSVFLTWKIWTYQPDYDFLLPTEDVIHQGIAEKRETHEVVRPDRIIYHYPEQRYTVAYPDTYQHTVIQGQIKNWKFHSFREVEPTQLEQWQTLMSRYQGIELAFATSIPQEMLDHLFQLKWEDSYFPAIDRLFIYQNPITSDVYALFISYSEQKMFRANTNMTSSELNQYLTLGEDRPDYEPVQFGLEGDKLRPVHYITTTPTEVTEYRYFYQRIQPDPLISYFFLDPTLVRQIEDRSGDMFYTDGTRGLQLYKNQLSMYYLHPLADSTQSSQGGNAVQRSIQFINQHRGWDQAYFLYQYQDYPAQQQVKVQFRRYIGSYPVMMKDENQNQDLNIIQLEVQHDRVTGYFRPLIEQDRVMSQVKSQLPPGTSVLAFLEQEGIHSENIERMYIAYFSDLTDHFISYDPYWVVQLTNGERKRYRNLESPEEEDLSNGLE